MFDSLKKFIRSFLNEYIGIEVIPNFEFFEHAFTHPSYKNVVPGITDYERLEMLGDSLVTLIVTHNLYLRGLALKDISTLRKELISGISFSFMAKKLGLQEHIKTDKGCPVSDSVLEDVYEAFMAAIYLNVGFDKTKRLVEQTLYKSFLDGTLEVEVDYKSQLQEAVQSRFKGNKLMYCVEQRFLEDQKRMLFTASVKMGDRLLGIGEDYRRKSAEQRAAQESLIKLDQF